MVPRSLTIIAHRGASRIEPENTLRAFQRAAIIGCQWIECDVRLTRDGVPVIIHDMTVRRTTNGRGTVSRMTNDELQTLDAGKGEKIPTLAEALTLAEKHKVNFVLEIKDPHALEPVIRMVRAYRHTPVQCILSSFSSAVILHAKTILPSLTTALITANPLKNWVDAAQHARADMIHAIALLVTEKRADTAHAAGLKVWAWMVNDIRRAQTLKKIGVDGFFTDYPESLCAVFP